MAVTTNQRHRAQELHQRLTFTVYELAKRDNMSVSAWLEREDPSDQYQDGLDAFERQMMLANIRTQTLPAYGVYADEMDVFDKNDQTRALMGEWLLRQARRAATGHDVSTRALYTSADDIPGSLVRPWADAAAPRMDKQIAPAIPIEQLIALTSPITGDAHRAYYLTDDPTSQRLVRVTELSEMPRTKLKGAENVTRTYVYGRVLEASYQSLRRIRLDKVRLFIQKLAVQNEIDKVAEIIDVIVNGDGNAGTAATVYNLTALDTSATAGTLTLAAWLAFKMKFANPYMATIALCREAAALQLMLLNTGSANIPLVMVQGTSGFGSLRQINPGLQDGMGLGWTADAPANQIVAFDNQWSVERVVEVGSNIEEIQRWSTKQSQTLTISEGEGYAILDPQAAKVLNLAA